MPTQHELFKSYKKKLYRKQHDLITDEERAANTAYHKAHRLSLNPDQQEAAKLSHAKYLVKKNLRRDAETYVRTQQPGFDTQPWETTYD